MERLRKLVITLSLAAIIPMAAAAPVGAITVVPNPVSTCSVATTVSSAGIEDDAPSGVYWRTGQFTIKSSDPCTNVYVSNFQTSGCATGVYMVLHVYPPVVESYYTARTFVPCGSSTQTKLSGTLSAGTKVYVLATPIHWSTFLRM